MPLHVLQVMHVHMLQHAAPAARNMVPAALELVCSASISVSCVLHGARAAVRFAMLVHITSICIGICHSTCCSILQLQQIDTKRAANLQNMATCAFWQTDVDACLGA
jgi:hypothetical protein